MKEYLLRVTLGEYSQFFFNGGFHHWWIINRIAKISADPYLYIPVW